MILSQDIKDKSNYSNVFKTNSHIARLPNQGVYTLLSPHHPLLAKLCQKWKSKNDKCTLPSFNDSESIMSTSLSRSSLHQNYKYSTPLPKKIVYSPDAKEIISQAEKSSKNNSRASTNTVKNGLKILPHDPVDSSQQLSSDDSEIVLNYEKQELLEPNVVSNKSSNKYRLIEKSPDQSKLKHCSSLIQNVKKHSNSLFSFSDNQADFQLDKQKVSHRQKKEELKSQTNNLTTILSDKSLSENENIKDPLITDESMLSINNFDNDMSFSEESMLKKSSKTLYKEKNVSSSKFTKNLRPKTQEHDEGISRKTASKKRDEIPSKEVLSKYKKQQKEDSSNLIEESKLADSSILYKYKEKDKQFKVKPEDIEDKAKQKYMLYEWYIRPLPKTAAICVEGQRRDLPPDQFWHSSAIVTRVSSRILLTYTKTAYKLVGDINKESMLMFGFPENVINDFEQGFPENWKESWDSVRTLFTERIFTERQSENTYKSKEHDQSKITKNIEQVTPCINYASLLNLDELPCTRSGRKVKPRLSYWTGQRITTSTAFDIKVVPGNLLDKIQIQRPHRKRSVNQALSFTDKRSHSHSYLLRKNRKTEVEHKENKDKRMKIKKSQDGNLIDHSNRQRKQDSSKNYLQPDTQKVKGEKTKVSEKPTKKKFDESTIRKRLRLRQITNEKTFSSRKPYTDVVKNNNREYRSHSAFSSDRKTSGKDKSRNVKDESSNFKESASNSVTLLPEKNEPIFNENVGTNDDDTDFELKKKLRSRSSTRHRKTNNSTYQLQSVGKKQLRNRREKNENIKGIKNCIDLNDKDWCSVKNIAINDLEGDLYSSDETFQTITDLRNSNKLQENKLINKSVKTYSNKSHFKASHHPTKTLKYDDSDNSEVSDDSESISVQSSESSIYSPSADRGTGKSVQKAKNRQSSQTETKNKLISRKRSNVTAIKNSKRSKVLHNQGADLENVGVVWSEEAISKLEKIVQNLPAETPCFWNVVAEKVKTHSAEECQEYYQSLKKATSQSSQSIKRKENVIIDAKQGTLKRRRQLRELLEEHNFNYEDNFFDSASLNHSKTPYILERFSFTTEDDDDEISIKTPKGREVLNKPFSEKKTPHLGSISPGILSSVNRNDIDQYINRVQKGKQGRHVIALKLNKKNTKVNSPYLKSQKIHSETGTFDLKQIDDDENESSDDYYFSD